MQNSILVSLTLFSYFSNHLYTLHYGLLEDAYIQSLLHVPLSLT